MTSVDMNLPPFREPGYVEPKIEVEHRADGSILLRNPHPLRPAPGNLIEPIRRWAAEAPDRTWLGKRKVVSEGLGDWDLLTYAEANAKVNAIAQALLDRGLDQSTPVMILSGNSIEHALMTYGAILAGVPAAPVSPSYSTMSSDFDKLRYVFNLLEPKLIFMQEAA
ncbi:MAG: AMP-binding protein, partial [Parvibaculaceae bacterium]